MTRDTVRWGVLSTANIGRVAVNPAIQASRNGTLDAIASRSEAKARLLAQAGDIPRWHGDYQALLDDPDIDAVYIPLPNSLHREWTIRAAEAGKHVLCEKPLALSPVECRDMERAAAASGVKLMEAFMYRFHPRIERLRELIAAGTIGEVRMIRSAFTFKLTRPDNIRLSLELGGGALMDVGCYCVNLSRTLAGEEPVEVSALARWGATGVDEQLAGTLRFPSGIIAHFDCALVMERTESCEVAGTDGCLRLDSAFLPGVGPVAVIERRGRENPESHPVIGVDQYRLMVEHFADCILTGAPVRYPAREAAANLATIQALLRSARQGGATVPV